MILGSSGSSPGPQSRRLQLDAAPAWLSPVGSRSRWGWARRPPSNAEPAGGAGRGPGAALPLSGEVSGGGGRGPGAGGAGVACLAMILGRVGLRDADPASGRCGPRPFFKLAPAFFRNCQKTFEQSGRRCQEEIVGFTFAKFAQIYTYCSVSLFKRFMCISSHSLCVYIAFVF